MCLLEVNGAYWRVNVRGRAVIEPLLALMDRDKCIVRVYSRCEVVGVRSEID